MQVFKAFMKITKKRLHIFLIYIICFIAIGTIMSMTNSDTEEFENSKVSVIITDLDNTPASRALAEYIGKIAEVQNKEVPEGKIQDALFYRSTDVVLTIEKGFEEKIESGETDDILSEYNIPGTFSAELFDSQLNRYIGMVRACAAGGMSMTEAFKEASELSMEEVETQRLSFTEELNSDFDTNIAYFFQYIPYIVLCVLLTSLCPTILILTGKEIRSRINCSCMSATSQLMQIICGTVIIVFGVYAVLMVTAAVLYGNMLFSTVGMYAIINAFVFILFAMMLMLLISVISPKVSSLNMIAQVIGLGSSFLCGVFVPQSMLSETVIGIGKFLPVYWYVKANNMISGMNGEVFESRDYMLCLGIQLAFTAALFFVALLVSRTKRSSKTI